MGGEPWCDDDCIKLWQYLHIHPKAGLPDLNKIEFKSKWKDSSLKAALNWFAKYQIFLQSLYGCKSNQYMKSLVDGEFNLISTN